MSHATCTHTMPCSNLQFWHSVHTWVSWMRRSNDAAISISVFGIVNASPINACYLDRAACISARCHLSQSGWTITLPPPPSMVSGCVCSVCCLLWLCLCVPEYTNMINLGRIHCLPVYTFPEQVIYSLHGVTIAWIHWTHNSPNDDSIWGPYFKKIEYPSCNTNCNTIARLLTCSLQTVEYNQSLGPVHRSCGLCRCRWCIAFSKFAPLQGECIVLRFAQPCTWCSEHLLVRIDRYSWWPSPSCMFMSLPHDLGDRRCDTWESLR